MNLQIEDILKFHELPVNDKNISIVEILLVKYKQDYKKWGFDEWFQFYLRGTNMIPDIPEIKEIIRK